VTIVIPVVKGTCLALKASGSAIKAVLQQGLKKTATKFVRELPEAIKDAVKAELKECAEGGVRCFPTGTLVLMADGARKPIEQIQEDEFVLAQDPVLEALPSPRRVLALVESRTEYLTDIGLDVNADGITDAEIQATNTHPMWTLGRGWVAASQLRSNDRLLSPSGSAVRILYATVKPIECVTWNLTVEGSHAFFVEDCGVAILAHNRKLGPRAYITYEAKAIYAGQQWAYVGKASMPWTSNKFSERKVLEYRYKRGYVPVRAPNGKIMRIPLENVTITNPFYEENSVNTGLSRSNGKPLQKGDAIVSGLEHRQYEDAVKRHPNRMFNKKLPVDLSSPTAGARLNMADQYLIHKDPTKVCPPR